VAPNYIISPALAGIAGASAADRTNHLGVVDALKVDRGDAEVGVAELALDHVQRRLLLARVDALNPRGNLPVQPIESPRSPRSSVPSWSPINTPPPPCSNGSEATGSASASTG
jgi:hypothetical protein